jgi:hypothetical protein
MNEKVLKNVNNVISAGSRGKSTEKQAPPTKIIAQPVVMNSSSSNKKLKTVGGGVGSTHGYLNSHVGQSREKSSQH